jgi:O-antigen ligase
MIFYYLFLFLIPFQDHPVLGAQLLNVGSFPITPVKLAGIPLVAAVLLMPRSEDAAPRPRSDILLLFAAFTLFQFFSSIMSSMSFAGGDASTLLSFGILIVATGSLINSRRRLQSTIRAIVVIETFASLWLYKQYYILHWPRPLGPSSDPNYEALSLVMMVPLGIWLARYEESRFWKLVGLVCAPVLAFAVVIAQSRGGVLAITVMSLVAWLSSDRKLRLAVAFVVAATPLLLFAPTNLFNRIRQIQVQGQAQTGPEISTRTRVELARAGLHMMEAHPVFGVGLDNFPANEFRYNHLLMSVIDKAHIAHNTYVQLGAEGGVPTLALYLSILGLTLVTCRRAEKLPGVRDDLAALAFSFRIGLIGFAVAAFFLTAEMVKEPWVIISLTPNLYAIAAYAVASSKKTVPTPTVVRATIVQAPAPQRRAG